jgi:GntR family transcriptional regulator
VSRDDAGRPVESFVAYHRGDRSRFEVDLTRGPNRGAGAAPLVIVTDGSMPGAAALA